MFDRWKLKDFAPGEGRALGAFTEHFTIDDEWIDISAPGDVYQALVAAGRVQDPFYDQNELTCAWVRDREWWYRVEFLYEQETSLQADERLQLVFEGLDTFATIWLNGQEIGHSSNMFREAVFDVTEQMCLNGPNTLALCFDRPLDRIKDMTAPSWGLPLLDDAGLLGNTGRTLMRKAQFGYGWDFGPDLPTVGIWRPVKLYRQRQAAIAGVHFATEKVDQERDLALISIKVEVEHFAGEGPFTVAFKLTAPGEASEEIAEAQTVLSGESGEDQVAHFSVRVEHPRLWWTPELGEPTLHTLQVSLRQGEVELDQQELQVGIRTLQLDQTPDPAEPGTHFFRFILNNVPIFARGANWLPASSLIGSVPTERYTALLTAARDANMNMLRIWGGGIYEQDQFYALCDQLGILLWHDFMFACGQYPEDNADFVNEVSAEVRYQVKRLRNHPSMALWCGNNESQMIHQMLSSSIPGLPPLSGTLYYDEIMPHTVQANDGHTPYWPGSPFGNGMLEGDYHDWHVWHGFPLPDADNPPAQTSEAPALFLQPTPEAVSFVHYAEDRARFVSEFGMHASPVAETLRRVIPPDQLYHHSPSIDHHNKDNPKNKGDLLMSSVTGLPQNLEEYIDFSMIAQAEGLKFGIEHFRRRKPHCSGSLIWQLNDCWPGFSWSILDYYGFGKASYYYVRRAYAPVLASFQALTDGTVELWLTNDTQCELNDTVVIQYGSFDKGVLREEALQVHIPANGSQPVWQSDILHGAASARHYLLVRSQQEQFPANRHFFTAVKDLERSPAALEFTITSQSEHEMQVNIHASSYAYFVYLSIADEQTHFSDNYFDMSAEDERTIVVSNPARAITPEMLSVAWR
ncbi:beta-mannosidase [Ktedonobacter racemifer]|uniref:Beta-mannosidase B n=1 Tax=Ktedonobacter racemifer DSM 44963 TaxID=485913 RepID=D6U892_KTERA|nr:glycoside hydrolase family 2 protein [Ktedonobacter racemifer]EFH80103.1 glycoside hydrolase family 2 sugar binding [Ktedonobacter racemifer DSM 44963]